MAEARAALADLNTLDRAALEALVFAQQEKLLSRDNEIEHLKLIIARPRRMMFGTKSEKVTREIEQLELKLEELETRQSERAATHINSHRCEEQADAATAARAPAARSAHASAR